MSELLPCGGKVSAVETGHAPCCPHRTCVQLTLGGDLHGQAEPVVLDEPITNTSSKVWFGELLDGGDLGPAGGDEESEEVHTTKIAREREEHVMCGGRY